MFPIEQPSQRVLGQRRRLGHDVSQVPQFLLRERRSPLRRRRRANLPRENAQIFQIFFTKIGSLGRSIASSHVRIDRLPARRHVSIRDGDSSRRRRSRSRRRARERERASRRHGYFYAVDRSIGIASRTRCDDEHRVINHKGWERARRRETFRGARARADGRMDGVTHGALLTPRGCTSDIGPSRMNAAQ